jgi:hypothetical protein
MSALDNIILRTEIHSPLVAVDRELTWTEHDNNWIILYDKVKELSEVEITGVDPYSAGTEYSVSDPYVTYNGNTWEYINPTPQTGITPGTDPLTWSLVSQGLFSHQQNKDQYLDLGGANEVSAEDIKSLVDAGFYDDSIVFLHDGSRPMTGDIQFALSNGLVWADSSYIKQGGGILDIFGNGVSGVQIQSPQEVILYNATGGTISTHPTLGIRLIPVSGEKVNVFEGLNLDYTTASTAPVIDSSKNLVSSSIATDGNILSFATGYGIDTTATGGSDVLNIGTTNAEVINIGNAGATVNILGAYVFEYTANAYVTDKLITLNKDGGASTGIGVGFEIEENSIITGYLKTNGPRTGFSLKSPANAGVLDIITLGTDVTLTAGNTGTIAVTANKLSSFASTTSAELAGVVSDETGFTTGAKLVFSTSPSFETSIGTSSSTFALLNTTPTTINFGGNASVALNIGHTSGANTILGATTFSQAIIGSTTLTIASDTDATTILGRAKIGSPTTDEATFAHFDFLSTTGYAVRQNASGATSINSPTGQGISLRINNSAKASVSASMFTLGASVNFSPCAGTTTVAPISFTSGTNKTTASAGDMEYNGTNLFFTRSGTTREGVLTQSAITTEVVVSDTTVTVNIGGVTYKLLARA